jgi:hypothetical protein
VKEYLFIGFMLWTMVFGLSVVDELSADSLTFSESLIQKVKSYREAGDVLYEVVDSGKYKITVKMDLNASQLTNQFDENTCFTLTAMGMVFDEVCLGQDTKYTVGKTSAKIIQTYEIAAGKTVTALITAIKWTKKHQLTFTVTGNIGAIVAGDYVGSDLGPIAPFNDTSLLVIAGDFLIGGEAFSELSYEFDVALDGEVSAKTVTKGKGEDAEEFEPYKVKVDGTGVWQTVGSFSGPWFLSSDEIQDGYLISDGAGLITECGIFYFVSGAYEVGEDGSFSVTLNTEGDSPTELTGTFTIPTFIEIKSPFLGTMTKISDASACSGTWTGTLDETSGGSTAITFTIDSSGAVTSFTGITGPVTGRMFCQAGKVAAFFTTAAGTDDPYNQISLEGTRVGDNITGSLYLDNAASVDGTFSITKL